MSNQPTLETVVTDSLARIDFGVTASPLPDKFGKDYRALHAHYIATLAEEVKDAPPITDKASREVSQKLRTRLVSVRTGLDKTRKALFEPLRNLKAEVDAYIGTTSDAGLQGRVKALEVVLEQQQEVWDAEQERIRQEAARKVQERFEARGRKLIEAGMVFDGACYVLLDLKVFPSDIAGPSDDEFEDWFVRLVLPRAQTKREADRVAEIGRIEQERTTELLAEGFERDEITGHLMLRDEEDSARLVMIEELGNMADEAYMEHRAAALEVALKRKAAKEAAAKAEHERMQAEFRRQAEVQRKQDEERAAIDAERAKLKAEKEKQRRGSMFIFGFAHSEAGKYYHIGGDLCVVREPLAELSEEEWDKVKNAAPVARERLETLVRRAHFLMKMGADGGIGTDMRMGDLVVTRDELVNMSSEEWNATLNKYEAAAAADQEVDLKTAMDIAAAKAGTEADDLPISTAPDEADLRELHACALSLLDEANKAFTALGSDERYSEALAKVQAHAGDCVRITRELQTEPA